ncbi:cupin domain-containing protein [Mesorhizobium sp. 1M-11]|uniref:cupin domain-containing protein n=1 Tax=Mesorhizobium sp. 1M-11 TaxID=1529006 RepID=UPI0009EA4B5E|nr:cupin domain-containing protein [Mesorhizobium sp. 1M-11]
MSMGLFQKIGYVKANQLVDGPITPGQNRRKALAAGNLWVGQCHVTALDAPSQWHHHEEFDSVMYMLSGRIRVDFGENGQDSFEIGKGDYAYFPRRRRDRRQCRRSRNVRTRKETIRPRLIEEAELLENRAFLKSWNARGEQGGWLITIQRVRLFQV